MKRRALTGQLDLLVLSVLNAGPAHGYRIIDVLRERSNGAFDLAEGTLYPALHRLERRALVASRWKTVGGRGRRVYRLTPTGRREFARQEASWRQLARSVEAVLG